MRYLNGVLAEISQETQHRRLEPDDCWTMMTNYPQW